MSLPAANSYALLLGFLMACSSLHLIFNKERWQQTRFPRRERQVRIKVKRIERAQRSAGFNLSTALRRHSGSYQVLQPPAIQNAPLFTPPQVCVDQTQHISCLLEETESSWKYERVKRGQLHQGGGESKPRRLLTSKSPNRYLLGVMMDL